MPRIDIYYDALKNLVTRLCKDIKPLYFTSHYKRPAYLNSSIKSSGSINEISEAVTNSIFDTAVLKFSTKPGVNNDEAFRWVRKALIG